MNDFLTWDVLLTFSGCVAGTVILTEWLKKQFEKLPAQLISFLISAAILVIGHIATATFAWAEAPLYLVNAVAVSLSANGGFDILKKAFGKEEATDELVLTDGDEDGTETYLNLTRDPKEFKDGEMITFKVKKISQE